MRGHTPEPKVSYRIPMVLAILICTFAIVGDALQLVLKLLWFTGVLAILSEGLGWMISLFVILINCIIFVACGVNFLSGKRTMNKIIRFFSMFLAEFLPLLNMVPTLFIWTLLTIRESRVHDRERAKENATIQPSRHTELRQRRLRERILRSIPPAQGVALALNGVERRKLPQTNASSYRPKPIIKNIPGKKIV